MKSIIKIAGNDGHKHYEPGDTIDGDGEWHRRMLVNGLADPQDDAARKIAESDQQKARYGSPGLAAQAQELAAADKPKAKARGR